MENKKLLAILGSPHPQGTTAAMLDCAVKAAENAGWTVDRVNLYDQTIAFCRGCEACQETRACVMADDIQRITALLKGCDRVVLAAPVYWANVPAVVKNLFDRLLGVAMEKTRTFPKPRLAGKQYLLLTSCHTPAPFSWLFGQSRGGLRAMKEFCNTAGMRCIGTVVYAKPAGKKELPPALIRKIERRWR